MKSFRSVKVVLKTMSDLQIEAGNAIDTIFFIDGYQRGYRWSKSDVRDLLEDIREFSQTQYENNDSFYCLQPIIVTKSDNNEWKVIDGQQRLTTLYLIYTYYISYIAGRKSKNKHPFEIHYKNKLTLEECLRYLSSDEFIETENFSSLDKYLKDIDCYFVIEAYKEICRYFNFLLDNPKLQNQVYDMRKVFDNYMKIIWYELINCDSEEEVSMFTKVNMGKIPLTNAELIKALLLKDINSNGNLEKIKSKQENIAVKWDEMESKLQDESFWSFLVNESDYYSTRIDFIFEVMAEDVNENILKNSENTNENYYVDKKYNPKYYSFHVFNNYMKYLKNRKNYKSIEIIDEIWNNTSEYYRMFNDWFKNRTWYHLIGFIIYHAGKYNIQKIYDLSLKYKKQDNEGRGHKTSFEIELKKLTKDIIGATNLDKQELRNKISELTYNNESGSDNKKIRSILLLYNLAALEVEEKTDVKFAFDKFKIKNAWDLEHINAVASERPTDESDIETNASLIWLKSALELPDIDKIYTSDNQKVHDLIKETIEKKLYLSKNDNSKFINIYESVINYFNELESPDSIGNLTLLDAGINRSYKNDVFPIKRKKIIEKNCSDIYIPLGTKKVFFKAYAESKNLLKWTQEDFDGYVTDIIDKISKYLEIR